jgi:tyrosyl-tRNA synthetase
MLARDRLRKRWDANKPLGLHELLYALAQGFDALHLHTDVQTGGSDQLFNLMAGRRLQEAYGQKPMVCITTPMLPGIDGGEKMSKSLGNYVGVIEPAEQQFGKLMSIPDNLIITYFELLTNISPEELAELKQAMADNKVNPMELKKRLAREIVTQLNSKEAADAAEEHFVKTVQKKEAPDIIALGTKTNRTALHDYLVENKLAKSQSEARRLIKEGAVYVNNNKVNDPHILIEPGMEIRKGRQYIKAT